MKGLTERQKQVLEFIKHYIRTFRYPPTIREIAEHLAISVKGAYDHLKALQRKQVVACNLNRSRAIKLIGAEEVYEDSRSLTIPILGAVAAGRPLFAEENMEGNVQVPESLLPKGPQAKGRYFALRVKGDSMKEAGIMDGDLTLIRHQASADNGDIVVALVDEAVALKRFFLEKNRVALRSENPAYPPIYTQNVRVLGKLQLLLRSYE
jgi:repressor LexA